MGAAAILNELRKHGVRLELKDDTALRAHGVLTDTLRGVIRENRDELLAYLQGGKSIPLSNEGDPGLVLHGPILLNLLSWIHKFNELTLNHPNGPTKDATPETALDLINTQPWTVLYDLDGYVLLTNGNVPVSALRDKRDLEVTNTTSSQDDSTFDENRCSPNKNPSQTQKGDLTNTYNSLPGITEPEGVA